MSKYPIIGCSDVNARDINATKASNIDLFLEFLNCVMNKDFRQAINLAKQILELEPDNNNIREFLPLLNDADHMKSAGFFHSFTDDSDSEHEDSEDTDSDLQASSTDSSDEFGYTSSDSDSPRNNKKTHGF
uniref:TPR_REGION domain-containing protein n=1 Tax=Trichobilharzia regenti TaxID=157069 RepID=A0AA85JE22_TRIRE|nr:unnamed protein product [Trichobilharzia regenti]